MNHFHLLALVFAATLISTTLRGAAPAENEAQKQLREYRNVAMGREGNPVKGRDIFNNEQGVGCVKCHSVDGSSSKAGPDLQTLGDKFPRGEIVRSIINLE